MIEFISVSLFLTKLLLFKGFPIEVAFFSIYDLIIDDLHKELKIKGKIEEEKMSLKKRMAANNDNLELQQGYIPTND